MPWSGSGTYSLPPAYSPEVNGTTVDAVRYNGLTSDVASGITAALAKNGENVPTANLPMGGFKHTGAADASATGQYIAFNQATAVGSLTITALTVTSATGGRFIVTGSTVPANGIYLSAANTLAFASNTTQRALVSAIGGWTFNAPTSGTTITANVFSGGQTAINSVAGAATTDYALNLFTGATVTGFTGIGNSAVVNTALRNAMGIGTQTAHDFVVMTNNTEKARISSAGNVTIRAPSSGAFLGFPGTAATAALCIQGSGTTTASQRGEFQNTSGYLRWGIESSAGATLFTGSSAYASVIGTQTATSLELGTNSAVQVAITSDGRLYGKSLHNNAGAVTGTTNQYIASGTYTPTPVNAANTSGLSGRKSLWTRVGNVVSVAGQFTCNAVTGSHTYTGVYIPLPIASNLATSYDLSGTCGFSSNWDMTGGGVFGDATGDRALVVWDCNAAASGMDVQFNFKYEVL